MPDINKLVTDERMARLDPDGNLAELEPWSPKIANQRAEEQGVDLTDEHWAIVFYLRERYRNHGPAANGAELLRELGSRFGDEHGRRRLFQLFPAGPVSQGSRIAGVPAPPHSSDASFGSVL